MWKWLEQFFIFTQSEKKAILLLITGSVIVLLIPDVYHYFSPAEEVTNSPYEKEVAAFIQEYNAKKQAALLSDTVEDSHSEFNPYASIELNSQFKKKERVVEYFEFDPNKIGVEEWVKLGFSEKQAVSIEKAKAKGWKFYKPDDLKKIFVIGEANYNRLAPYIRIEDASVAKKEYTKTTYPEKPKEKYVVDINTADSSLFERQRGIGPALASRIIRYRNRLGGFVSVSQISEVWGLPDSTYQNLKDRLVLNEFQVSKININVADIEAMKKHPYINYTLAKVVKSYREQHGNFKSVEDLRKVPIVNDSIYGKLLPYISIN